MTTFGDMVYQFGGSPVSSLGSGNIGLAGGDVFFVNGTTGLDGNSAKTPGSPRLTLNSAYGLTTANRNDIVIAVSSGTAIQIGTAALTWAKQRTHLIGAGSPNAWYPSVKIKHNFNVATVWTVSGNACSFENFCYEHGNGSGTNVTGMNTTSDFLYFGNVNFAGPAGTEEADEDLYTVLNTAAGSDCHTFERCAFGAAGWQFTDGGTLVRHAGGQHILYKDCDFSVYISSEAAASDATCLEVAGGQSVVLILDNCSMICRGPVPGVEAAQAIDFAATEIGKERIIIKGPFLCAGFDDVADAVGDGGIFMQRATETANVLGLALSPAVT